MKFIVMALLAIPAIRVFSQNMQFTVAANDKSITVSPDNDNTNTLFVITHTSSAVNKLLTIHVMDEEMDREWKRSFSIYDSSGNAVKDFDRMKNGDYCTSINELSKLLEPQQDYLIYTSAIPKDPEKAMLVKVARIPVCRIRIL